MAAPALRNDGHFTTFQLRGGAVLGLALHLQRLDTATRALFGVGLDAARVRKALSAPLAATATRDATVRITVVPRAGSAGEGAAPEVDVLVSLAPPAEPGTAPLRLQSFVFQRDTPAIKHAGTFPLFQHQRLARRAGADDALFVDASGHVIEGTVWNLGLWDGHTLTWPQADALRGTRERLLQAGLSALGVPQRIRPAALAELAAPIAAFACNSRGQQRIGSVDGRPLSLAPELDGLLAQALATQPAEPVD
nr:aminotransferase class IV [Luteimonas sp. XNQY3]